jgi:hypothetical protein
MDRLSDEMIAAWLDGEVTQEQRDEIEAAIAAKPELGMHVARLSRVDRLLAPAYAETLNAPIPERFEALLAKPRRRVPGFASLGETLSGLLSPRPMALAAASLVVGIVLGGVVLSAPPSGPGIETDGNGRMIANGPMAVSLASVTSGATSGSVNIRLSVVDDGGRYCRQFETAGSAGLACLEGRNWVIDTLSQAGGAPGADGVYVMADGSTDPAIAAALQRRGVRHVLDGREESLAIRSGWKAPAN